MNRCGWRHDLSTPVPVLGSHPLGYYIPRPCPIHGVGDMEPVVFRGEVFDIMTGWECTAEVETEPSDREVAYRILDSEAWQ